MKPSAASAASRHFQAVDKQSDRGAYEHLKSQQNAGRIRSEALATEGYLRSEVALSTQNTVNFGINEGSRPSPANNTEVRLATSDAFLVTHIGLFLKSTEEDPADNAASKLVTYDAESVNAGGNIMAVYNGFLRIGCNQTTFFEKYDAMRFYRAGTAQQSVEVSTANPYLTDTWDSVNYGFASIVPFITFGGTDSNRVELELPANIDLSANNATAVFICRGLLIQNV